MSRKSAKVLPIIFPKTEKAFDEKTCAICFKGFNENKATLPCGHVFHAYCALTWFEKKMECPMCRMKLAWTKTNGKKVDVTHL
tara:strand:- start:90 stop:338 length:249 start_codon:yes stop_codon:yes gene_type:complete